MKKLLLLLAAASVCCLSTAQPNTNPLFLPDMGYTNGGWRVGETVRTTGDVNGDGKADLIGFSSNAVRVAFSNGTNFSAVQVLNQDFNGWSYQKHIRTTGDVNGDGKADLIGFGDFGTFVAFSTGSGFTPLKLVFSDLGNVNGGWAADATVRCVGDVNGDGKADLIGYSGQAVRVAFSNGNSFSPVQILNEDFSGWSFADHVRTVGDVNGDGKVDLVGFGEQGTYVAFSTGNGFGPLTMVFSDLGSASGWNARTMVRIMADMNGDHKADIVGFNTDHVVVCYSNGSGFEGLQVISNDFSKRSSYTFDKYVVTAADVNGDGSADLMGFGDKGVYVQLSAQTVQEVTPVVATIVQPAKTDYVVSTLRADYSSEESIVVEYSGFKGVGGEWINIQPVGKPDDDWGKYEYVRAKEGRLKFDNLNLAPGEYEVRAYRGGLDYNVAGRAKFTVR